MTRWFVLLAILLGVAACGEDPGTRALTGGAIGAGTGAVVGTAVAPGIGWLPGAAIGGVSGAVIGAATTPLSW